MENGDGRLVAHLTALRAQDFFAAGTLAAEIAARQTAETDADANDQANGGADLAASIFNAKRRLPSRPSVCCLLDCAVCQIFVRTYIRTYIRRIFEPLVSNEVG